MRWGWVWVYDVKNLDSKSDEAKKFFFKIWHDVKFEKADKPKKFQNKIWAVEKFSFWNLTRCKIFNLKSEKTKSF